MSAALLSAAILSQAQAAGLGRLTVQSSLGQPLRAEIELTAVAADELSSLQPRLASPEAFRQANIDLNPALLSLRFTIEQRAGNPVIRVTSVQPINEPFVDMLLELGGNRGRLVREYTFLLDPPEMRSTRPAQVAPIVNSQLPAAVSNAPAPQPITPTPTQSAAPVPVAQSQATSPAPAAAAPRPAPQAASRQRTEKVVDEHTVKRGDTLAKIANQYREPGVSLDQMLVALYRANPDAFVDRNMNRLRTGQILSIPAATEAETIGSSEARGVVVAQASDFNAYRDKLAAQTAASTARPSEEGRQSASGSITARVQEENQSGSPQDRLQLSKSGANTGQNAAAGRSGPTDEEMIARDKALAEANARVRELEKNVNDLQKLLEVKNQDLAAQQKQAEKVAQTASAAANTPPPSAAAQAEATPAPVTPATEAPTPAVVETAAPEQPPAPAAPAQEAPKPEAKKPVPPPPVPVAEPSFFEDLTNNSMFLPGAAALLALLAGLGIYSSRRRKQQAPKAFEDSIITDSSLKANSLFGSTGGQSVDTNNSVFNSNFVPSASQLDTNEVDPIAEADVYIAYGRDAQAEEILKEALRHQPDRHAVRVKLLEIYSSRGDTRSFEILATELYSMTKGEGEEWRQAAALGLALDPNNPLYGSGTVSDDFAEKAALLTAPTQPLDPSKLEELLDDAPETQLDQNPVIETSPYFNNTTLLTDTQSPIADAQTIDIEPQPELLPEPARVEEPKVDVQDLEFDLDGFGLDDDKKAETDDVIVATNDDKSTGLPEAVTSIDFDFLDKPATLSVEDVSTPDLAATDLSPVVEVPEVKKEPELPKADAAPEILVPEAFDFTPPPVEEKPEPVAAKPEDFDLSGISLELDPTAPKADESTLPSLEGLDESYSGSAEMATKLDLALAYQEIGDKEGARELLEEVVKGGNGEQSAKASELLSKLS